MELADYLQVLRSHWRSVTVVTLLAVLAAAGFSLLVAPTYTSSASLFISLRSASSAGDLSAGSTYANSQVRSFAQVAVSPLVLDPVIADLGLDTTATELAERVTATVPTNTATITLTVTDGEARMAAEIAAAVSNQLVTAIDQLAPPSADGSKPVMATIITPANLPTAPTSPNVPLNLALGLLIGLALGVGQALVREALDQRVRTTKDVEQLTDRPVLGSVPLDESATNPLTVQADPHSTRSEAYRRLRTNLQFLGLEPGRRVIVVSSSVPGEGKSSTSINLAATLALAGDRVLLIDADLRRPKVASYLRLEGSVGLTTVLIGEADLDDVVQPYAMLGLDVLTAGRVPPNPAELLGFDPMARLLRQAGAQYDYVIIDSPPLLPVTDAAVLAQHAGGVVLVVGSRLVTRPELTSALGSLEQVDAKILGLLVNKVHAQDVGHYGYRYHYRDEYRPQPATTGEAEPPTAGTKTEVSVPKEPDQKLPMRALSSSHG